MLQTGTSYIGSHDLYPPHVGREVQNQDHLESRDCWETILLVEDEAYVREITCEVLEMCGYTVVSAKNAAEAIRLFEDYEGVINLLVTDVVMPGMDGRELAKRLIERSPELRAIFISGYTDNAVVRNGFRDPNTVYLPKPFTLESLARKVREVIDGIPGTSPARVN